MISTFIMVFVTVTQYTQSNTLICHSGRAQSKTLYMLPDSK